LALQQVNNASKNIITFLNNPDRDVEILTANSIWARKGTAFKEEFLRTVQDSFDAKAGVLDENDPAQAINNWVAKQTKNMIPKIIDQVGPLQVMFMVNAIYFKGAWKTPFDQDLTREEEFNLGDGSKKMCPMMRLAEAKEFRYLETPDFEAIELPYGESGRLAMYLFLPEETDAFLANLSIGNWDGWMDQFQILTGTIVMPRFRVEFSRRLNEVLKSLGMEIAFDPAAADFGAMSDDQTWIDFVDHRAVAEVNEKGTQAAAATIVVHTLRAGPKAQFQMRADRPFLLAIRDNQSGAILFMGLINNPQT
jgi:serpin B